MFHLKMIKTVLTFSRYMFLSTKDNPNTIMTLNKYKSINCDRLKLHIIFIVLYIFLTSMMMQRLFPITCCEGFIVNTINHYLYANCLTTYLGNLFVASTAKLYEYDHICGISHSFLLSCYQHQFYSLFIQMTSMFFILKRHRG